MIQRHVRLLRLSGPTTDAVQRGRTLLEDALRTASLPAPGGRTIAVRRLDVGRIDTARSSATVALGLERCFAAATTRLIHGDDPAAPQASAVWFRDAAEAMTSLAVRLASRQRIDQWFWPLLVPAARDQVSREAALRAIVLTVASQPAAPLVLLSIVRELHLLGHADRLLEALRAPDGPRLLAACGWSPVSAAVPASAARAVGVTPAWQRLTSAWIQRWTPTDARSAWLAAISLAAERPALLSDPRLPARSLPGIVAAIERATAPTPEVIRSPATAKRVNRRRAAIRPSRASLAQPARLPAQRSGRIDRQRQAVTPGSAELIEPHEPPREQPAAVAEEDDVTDRAPRWPDEPLPTPNAGLFFVLRPMAILGLPELLDRDADLFELELGRRIVRHVADRLAIPSDDPIRMPLQDIEELARPDLAALERAWLTAVRRWCHQHLDMGVSTLVRRPGLVLVSRTHLDVFFALNQVDIRLRRSGVDFDPGWLPWFGRVVQFHYTQTGETDADRG